jgi:hypothetical protein
MTSNSDHCTELVAASILARENAALLMSYPTDDNARVLLIRAVHRVREIARDRGMMEVVDLADFVLSEAQHDLSPTLVISNLNRAVARIVQIVSFLRQHRLQLT